MSLQYHTIFSEIGRSVYFTNLLIDLQNTLYLEPTFGMGPDFQAVFGNDMALIPNFLQQVQGFASTIAGQISTLTQATNAVLANIQLPLNAPSSTPTTIIPLLARQMLIDGQSVLHNVIATPSVVPLGTNVTNDVLLVSTLFGTGVTDERSLTQDVQLICTSSQYNGGSAGNEAFSLTGYPQLQSPNVYGTLGNGTGPTIRVADSSNIIQNGNFASFGSPTADVPNSWTLSAGTATTNCVQAATGGQGGRSAVELKGDGSTTTITLTQNIASSIRSTTVYGFSVWLKKGGTVTAGSTLTINITGSGAATQTVASLDPSTLTTSYVQYHMFFNSASAVPPSNYSVNISWTAANASGGSSQVYIADCVLVQPTAFGSIQYCLFRGSVDPVAGDSYNVFTTVSSYGLFQEYFCRIYGAFLPSSATPTISDILASSSS